MGARTRGVQDRTWPLSPALTFAALMLWLIVIAFVRKLSIDESQYVASAVLTAGGILPYRDYAYLQTPLQPFAFAPLQWLFAGHVLIAMRLANALLGFGTLILVFATSRRIGAGERSALAAAAMLAVCEAFTWSAGVARNRCSGPADDDGAVRADEGRDPASDVRRGGGARPRRRSEDQLRGACGDGLRCIHLDEEINRATQRLFVCRGCGCGPAAELGADTDRSAPVSCRGDPLPGGRARAILYRDRQGMAARAEPLLAAADGRRDRPGADREHRDRLAQLWGAAPMAGQSASARMLAAAIGGLVSAALNRPFQIFYLLPALPPLFVLAALLFDESEGRPAWLKGAWGLSVAAGLVPVAAWAVHAASAGVAPAVDAQRRADALRAELRAQHIAGPIATLAGQYVPDAKAELDRRFAAGPFLYRTRGFVSADQVREWQVVTRDQTGTLGDRPPAAIVTGDYPDVQPAQEMELADQARALGYRPVARARPHHLGQTLAQLRDNSRQGLAQSRLAPLAGRIRVGRSFDASCQPVDPASQRTIMPVRVDVGTGLRQPARSGATSAGATTPLRCN